MAIPNAPFKHALKILLPVFVETNEILRQEERSLPFLQRDIAKLTEQNWRLRTHDLG